MGSITPCQMEEEKRKQCKECIRYIPTLSLQKLRRLSRRLIRIREMRRRRRQRTITHQITSCTIHLQVTRRVARDAAVVLLVAGIAEEHDAFDLVACCCGELGDGTGNHGGPLTTIPLVQ